MKQDLWYLFGGTRGGPIRVQIVRLLGREPRNANQLANTLDIEYNTVRYHLEKLVDGDILESDGAEYGEQYRLTDAFERHRETFEAIAEQLEDS